MGRKSKIPAEEKLRVCKQIAEGRKSVTDAALELRLHRSSIQAWVSQYRENGALAFVKQGNNKYSEAQKLEAVVAYLAGKGSFRDVSAKYGIRSPRLLQQWVKMYNNGEDLSSGMSGGSYMRTSKEFNYDERLEMVRDCIENGSNYAETAVKYDVSYHQLYNWVQRFIEYGEAGLEDRRGKRKIDQEPRNEIEELKIKLAQLEHELYLTKIERDLLKKVEELERGDVSRK